MSEVRYFVDKAGRYLGATDGEPLSAYEVEEGPHHVSQVWNGSAWSAPSTIEQVTVVFPADLWRRATDEEAEAIDQAMGAQPLRIRRIFQNAQSYQSDDELWPLLMGAAIQLFGEARAAVLLESSLPGA
ncbi:hypothetical protein PZ895_08090 [Mesorhizobium sp. YIM 152430]|uniref:hypothetical protein n=1 Tax=Mesorhizobium sp. YIM 152430 TaxID=3031761 RepID=UPI0023DCD192|nr:hypothetical protein [Mesorhizobium sp. YIM 152430]MDF1599736.1 hypothetical protein [Mesorhizobium sp. YIM 152430]